MPSGQTLIASATPSLETDAVDSKLYVLLLPVPLSCGGCNRRGRYLRRDEPPQDVFDGEAVAKPLILRFDGSCGADGEAVVYFSVFLMNSNEHRMKFLPRTETCGITCPYEVRFACF